jgi:hypothetical protein
MLIGYSLVTNVLAPSIITDFLETLCVYIFWDKFNHMVFM